MREGSTSKKTRLTRILTSNWRSLAPLGYPDYEIDEHGQVRSWKTTHRGLRAVEPHILRPDKVYGYNYYWLINGEGRKTFRGGRLALLGRRGPPPTPKHEACHKNGKRDDDRITNLYWGTKKQNAADQERHGTRIRGDRHPSRTRPERLRRGDTHPQSKVPDAELPTVRKLRAEGWSQKRIAERYGVTQAWVSLFLSGGTRATKTA
jgi:hypothetical protein